MFSAQQMKDINNRAPNKLKTKLLIKLQRVLLYFSIQHSARQGYYGLKYEDYLFEENVTYLKSKGFEVYTEPSWFKFEDDYWIIRWNKDND